MIACGANVLELGITYEEGQDFGRVYDTIHMTGPQLAVANVVDLPIGWRAKDTSMDEVIAILFNTALDKYRMVDGGLGVRWWCYEVLRQLGHDGVLTIGSRYKALEALRMIYSTSGNPYPADVRRGDFIGRFQSRGPTPEEE